MKRKIFLIPLALLLAISLVAIGCAAPAPEPVPGPPGPPAPAPEVIILIYNGYMAPQALLSIEEDHFMDLVEEKSNGRIKFDRYWGGALSSGPEVLGSVASGSSHCRRILVQL